MNLKQIYSLVLCTYLLERKLNQSQTQYLNPFLKKQAKEGNEGERPTKLEKQYQSPVSLRLIVD